MEMRSRPTAARAHTTNWVPLLRAVQSEADDAPEALESLLTELYPHVWHFLRPRLVGWRESSEVINDVTQETMVRLCMRIHQCRANTNRDISAWACTAARHTLVDLLRSPASGLMAQQLAAELETDLDADDHELETGARRADNHIAAELSVSLDEACGLRPAEPAARERLLALVVQAYNAAATDTGELLWWRLVMGADWSEVGVELHTSTAGAKRRYQRALATLEREVRTLVQALPEVERGPVEALLERYLRPASAMGGETSNEHATSLTTHVPVPTAQPRRRIRFDAA